MVEVWMKNRAKQHGSIAMSDHLQKMEKKRKNKLKNIKSDIKKDMKVCLHLHPYVKLVLLVLKEALMCKLTHDSFVM